MINLSTFVSRNREQYLDAKIKEELDFYWNIYKKLNNGKAIGYYPTYASLEEQIDFMKDEIYILFKTNMEKINDAR